jgi:hypothetical protein
MKNEKYEMENGKSFFVGLTKKALDFFFRIDPDLHPLKYLHILIC